MEKKYEINYETWFEDAEELFVTCLIAITIIGPFLLTLVK